MDSVEIEFGWVPDSLEEMPPGCVLGAALDDINLESCTPFDRIRVLRAYDRMAAHYQAKRYQVMGGLVDAMAEDPDEAEFAEEAASAEIAAALRLTRRAADSETSFAIELRRRLPLVFQALCRGAIDVRRARVIVNATSHLTPAGARDVVDHVIGDASLLTTGQLGAKLRKLCIDTNPNDAKHRYQHAVEERRVVVEANDTGTANLLILDAAPDRVVGLMNQINKQAKQARGPGETRTMDQLRTDILLNHLQNHETDPSQPSSKVCCGGVGLVVDLVSLAGLSNTSGELNGYGPVADDIARQVTSQQQDTTWSWTITHPETGQPIHTGTTRRRPATQQQRQVVARSRTCIHPGCRMPSTQCDLDHTKTWADGGPTRIDNLAPLCRYHHNIKHRHGWTYQPIYEAEFGEAELQPRRRRGDHLFTSRTGHKYTTTGQSP